MEIKNLLAKLHHSQPESQQVPFLALYLTDDILQLAIWQVRGNQVEILTLGSSVSWDGASSKSLAQAVDQSLTTALTSLNLPSGSEPNQIVFGLPNSWLDDHNDLKPAKKKLLKELSHQLDFEPLGFTLFLESLLVYLQQKEGTPINALLFHLNDLEITLSLVRQGKFVQTETLDRTDDFVADCETLLKRLDQTTPLPSRLILFDGHHDLQSLVQLLNSQELTHDFNFLHLPQIEALPKDVGIHAVALIDGREIAKSLGLIKPSISTDPLSPPQPSPTPKLTPSVQSTQLEKLGFALDRELDQSKPLSSSEPSSRPSPKLQPKPKPKPKRFTLPSFSWKKPSLSLPSLPKLPLILTLLSFLLILGGLAAFLWFVPQVDLVIYLHPQNIQTKFSFKLDPNLKQIDFDHQVLPANQLHRTLSGQKTIPTTGTGLAGDKAQGVVTIYNRTNLSKTFTQGTVLTANKLKFTLAETVTVASQSTAADYTETPGKIEAKIVAADIGDNYNLPAETEFKIANYATTSFVARNRQPLTGGNAHQVKLVAQADLDKLYKNLLADLKTSLRSQTATSSAGLMLVDQGFKVLRRDYSHKLGQEADKLDLNLELDFYGLAYRQEDLNRLVAHQLKDRVPLGSHLVNQDIKINLSPSSEASRSVQVLVKAPLLPDLSLPKLARLLKGKSPTKVSSLLHSLIPQFAQADLKFKPAWLPPRLHFLPLNPANLHLSVKAL